ncbi:6256_t:CDS:2, partial [Funneliformis geosporum]
MESFERAILLEPQIVGWWKEIGYESICNDVNELVLEGALLILFPPSPTQEWICPSVENVTMRLKDLMDIGFNLNNKVIIDILQIFDHKLDDIGEIIWIAFTTIRTGETTFSFVSGLFEEAFKTIRCLKKSTILNFLKSKTDQHELIIKQIVEKIFNNENVYDFEFKSRRKSLILSPKVYEFILMTYGNESDLTFMCFKDIAFLKIYYDNPLNASPTQSSTSIIGSINDIYEIYKQKIKYIPEYIEQLKRAK